MVVRQKNLAKAMKFLQRATVGGGTSESWESQVCLSAISHCTAKSVSSSPAIDCVLLLAVQFVFLSSKGLNEDEIREAFLEVGTVCLFTCHTT